MFYVLGRGCPSIVSISLEVCGCDKWQVASGLRLTRATGTPSPWSFFFQDVVKRVIVLRVGLGSRQSCMYHVPCILVGDSAPLWLAVPCGGRLPAVLHGLVV